MGTKTNFHSSLIAKLPHTVFLNHYTCKSKNISVRKCVAEKCYIVGLEKVLSHFHLHDISTHTQARGCQRRFL